jgi:hypothetical protein
MLMIILLSVVLDSLLSGSSGELLKKVGTNMVSLFIVFGLLYWVGMARLVRGQMLQIKKNEYVLAAKALGASPAALSAAMFFRQHERYLHLHRASNPERYFHGELFELRGPWRSGAYAEPRFPCEHCARGPAKLPVQAGFPGRGDLPDRAGV